MTYQVGSKRRAGSAAWRRRHRRAAPSRSSAALTALVLGAALLAGCRSGGGGLSVQEQRSVVLQPADLHQDFVRFDVGPTGRLDPTTVERREFGRFGRKGGWKARYRRPGSIETMGPLVIVSTVDVFDSERGAVQDLDAYRRQLDRQGELLETLEVGDEAVAMKLQPEGGAPRVVFFTIAWRQANATASVSVNGFEGKVDLDDAATLARKQERRLAAAAGD